MEIFNKQKSYTVRQIAQRLNSIGLRNRNGKKLTTADIWHDIYKLGLVQDYQVYCGKTNDLFYFDAGKCNEIYKKRLNMQKNTTQKENLCHIDWFTNLQPKKDNLDDLKRKHNGLVDHAKEVNQKLEDLLILYNKQQIEINELKQVQKEKDWYKNQYNNLLRDYDNLLKETSKKNIFQRIFGG